MTLIHFVSHRELIILNFFKHHGIKFIEKNIHLVSKFEDWRLLIANIPTL